LTAYCPQAWWKPNNPEYWLPFGTYYPARVITGSLFACNVTVGSLNPSSPAVAGTVTIDFGDGAASAVTFTVNSPTSPSPWMQANYSYPVDGSYNITVTFLLAGTANQTSVKFPLQADQSLAHIFFCLYIFLYYKGNRLVFIFFLSSLHGEI
jgi:hypothetical protein